MGSSLIGNGQQHTVPLETIQSLLSQYGQQLLCLEADLNERARKGIIKPKVFRRRMTRLKEVQLKLKVLHRHCLREVQARASGDKGELPLISCPTPLEETISDHFFASSADFTTTLEREVSLVHKWLHDAVSGKPFAFRHILRLSKLRRMIGRVERRTNSIQDLAKGLDLQVEKLLHQTGIGQPPRITKNSMDGLVSLFQAVEKMVTRVAQLKSQIRDNHLKAMEMEAWINKVEAQARSVAPLLDVPTPLAITQFTQEFQEADAAIQKARAKKELAEAFLKDVVISKSKTQVHSEPPYNVQKLHLQSKEKMGPQAIELCDVPSYGPPAVEVSTP